jgi:ribonuclease J
MRDRKHLSQDGLIIVTTVVNSKTRTLVSSPDIVSRGFVYVKESEQLINNARQVAKTTIENCFNNNITDVGIIKAKLRDEISRLMYEKTKRSPMILPVMMDVK